MSEMKQDAARYVDLINEVQQIRNRFSMAEFSRVDFVDARREEAEEQNEPDEVMYLAERAREVAIECVVSCLGRMITEIEQKSITVFCQIERDWFDLMAFWRRGRYQTMLNILRQGDSFNMAEVLLRDFGQTYSLARRIDGKEVVPTQRRQTGKQARRQRRRAFDEVMVERVLSALRIKTPATTAA